MSRPLGFSTSRREKSRREKQILGHGVLVPEYVWTLRALECSPWRQLGPFVVHLCSPAPLVPRSAGNAREHFPKINDVQLLS